MGIYEGAPNQRLSLPLTEATHGSGTLIPCPGLEVGSIRVSQVLQPQYCMGGG